MMDPNKLEQGGYPPPPAETAQTPEPSEQAPVYSDAAPQQAPRPAGPEMQAPPPSQAPVSPPQPNCAPGYYGAQPMQNNPNPYQNPYYGQQAPVPPPPPYPQQPVNPPPYAQPQYKPEGLAIASMVLGICSVVLGSLVCAILALVFSSRVKSHYPNGNLGPNTNYVKVGKICGAVGLGISIFVIVLVIVCLIILFATGTFNYYYNFPYYLNY